MFSGAQIAELLRQHGITHVVTVPDSTLGRWEAAMPSNHPYRVAAAAGLDAVQRELRGSPGSRP